jgi:hypothetical protein
MAHAEGRGKAIGLTVALCYLVAMSTTKAPRLAPIAQQAASFLRLFRGGVFEDNFLDVSRIDAGAWESARAELEEAALLTVEWDFLLAGRPYLRLPETKASGPGPAGAALAAVRARHVEVYRALMMAVRQAFHGPKPKHGMDIMTREEANFRRAVGWARDLGDTANAAEMGDVFTRYLDRAGRTDDRDRWVAWLAGEGPGEEAAAPVEEEAAAPVEEKAAAPVEEKAAVQAAPEPPAPAIEGVWGGGSGPSRIAAGDPQRSPPIVIEPAGASPEGVAVQAQETEGARLQREGAAAVAEGQIARAAELYQQALRWFQDARDTAGVAETCELFGAMEEAAGRPDGARVWYERAAAKRGR